MKKMVIRLACCLCLAGCGLEQMNDNMTRSNEVIQANSATVEKSSEAIHTNTQAILQSTEALQASTEAISSNTAFLQQTMQQIHLHPYLAPLFLLILLLFLFFPSLLLYVTFRCFIRKLDPLFEKLKREGEP